MKLMHCSLEKYTEELASNQPAPGGGSAAALMGALGASLTQMVVNLTIGKKCFESLEKYQQTRMLKEFDRAKKVHEKMLHLVDEDKRVFEIYMLALRLPKATEEEKKIRQISMDGAIINCLKVPLSLAEECYVLLQNQEFIALYGNQNVISDAGIAAHATRCALESAIMNVRVNLPYIKDESLIAHAEERIVFLETYAVPLARETIRIVNERIKE